MTKFCKGCGKIMWDVDPRRKLCDACREIPADQRGKPKPQKKRKMIKFKSMDRCVKEAKALHISYGQYVARGLDREVLTDEDFAQ